MLTPHINHAIFRQAVEAYSFHNVRPHTTKLIASSPFGKRPDNLPSFFVNLDDDSPYFGCWSDKGAVDSDWQSGGPVKLYAFIRNISYEEAVEELTDASEDTTPKLRVRLRAPTVLTQRKPLDITPYLVDEIPYLNNRGITPIIQRLYRCGFDSAKNAVVMPWANTAGIPVNAKWRATWGKAFWYAKDGAPVRDMVFGIDLAYRRRIKRAVIVEAEIDAMSAASAGVFGLAVGGSEFTDFKAELLRRSPVEELLIAGDNDAAGEKLRWKIERKMRGLVRLAIVRIPDGNKDLNDTLQQSGTTTLRDLLNAQEPRTTLGFRLASYKYS